MLKLDHIFICCDCDAPEAEALIKLGLKEGSGNVHPGQGTANRRFFFQEGFIELLWVTDSGEAQSKLTAPTRLWERWSQRQNEASLVCPFGIAFSPSGNHAPVAPFEAWEYNPKYLPVDKKIYFAKGTTLLEPELFYLAWPNTAGSAKLQPKDHKIPLISLVSASVGLPDMTSLSKASRRIQDAGLLKFYENKYFEITLEFQSDIVLDFNLHPALPVIIRSKN